MLEVVARVRNGVVRLVEACFWLFVATISTFGVNCGHNVSHDQDANHEELLAAVDGQAEADARRNPPADAHAHPLPKKPATRDSR